MSTQAGLESFNPDPQPVPVLQAAADYLWSVHCDSGGRIWVGTTGEAYSAGVPPDPPWSPAAGEGADHHALLRGAWPGNVGGARNGLWRAAETRIGSGAAAGERLRCRRALDGIDRQSRLWLGLGGALLCREAGNGPAFPFQAPALRLPFPPCWWIRRGRFGWGRRDTSDSAMGFSCRCNQSGSVCRAGLPAWWRTNPGFLWIGSSDGIFRISRAGFAWADEPRTGPLPRRFAVEDGLGDERMFGQHPARGLSRARPATLVCHFEGESVVDPGQLRPNPVAPTTVIEEVSIDGVPVFSNGPLGAGRREHVSGGRICRSSGASAHRIPIHRFEFGGAGAGVGFATVLRSRRRCGRRTGSDGWRPITAWHRSLSLPGRGGEQRRVWDFPRCGSGLPSHAGVVADVAVSGRGWRFR